MQNMTIKMNGEIKKESSKEMLMKRKVTNAFKMEIIFDNITVQWIIGY